MGAGWYRDEMPAKGMFNMGPHGANIQGSGTCTGWCFPQQQGDAASQIEAKRTYELSPCDTFSMNALRTVACASSTASPNATISTATLFFFSFFASLTMFFSSAPWSLSGEPTKTMMRCLRFLFCRCLRASCATEIAVGISATPPTLLEAVCKALRIWPCSLVLVARTSGLHQS